MHKLERDHECIYCDKKFGGKGDLNRHLRLHEKSISNSVDPKITEHSTNTYISDIKIG